MKLLKKLNNKAFSHIELVLVILVIGLIAGIGLFVVNRSKDKSSNAETANNPIPVYRMAVNFTDGSNKLNYYDWAVGNQDMKSMVDSGNGAVINKGVAFMAYPQSHNSNGQPETSSVDQSKAAYYLTATGHGKRLKGPTTNKNIDLKTTIFTLSKSTKNVLTNGGGFLGDGFVKVQPKFRLYSKKKSGNVAVYRLWKTFTENGRRNYMYTDDQAVMKAYKKGGYHKDKELMYAPSTKDNCTFRMDTKYGQVCNDEVSPAIPPTPTTPRPNEGDFTRVLNAPKFGKVYACVNTANFFDGFKTWFEGNEAKELGLEGYIFVNGQSPTSRSVSTSKNQKLIVNNIIWLRDGTTGINTLTLKYKFLLSNNKDEVKSTALIDHSSLKTCAS